MICIVALIVFSILGIFSATHRILAGEALDCVFRRVTFRPCNTGFKEKVRSKIVGQLLTRSAFAARVFNKYYEVFAWIFFVLMVASTVLVIRGGYNFYMYGSCDGLNQTGFCIFDPTGSSNKMSSIGDQKGNPADKLTISKLNLSEFPRENAGAKNSIVFIGSYSCGYTREAYPIVKKLADSKGADFTFVAVPVNEKTNNDTKYSYCAYKQDPVKFWDFAAKLFALDVNDIDNEQTIMNLAKDAGFDAAKLKTCATSKETAAEMAKQTENIKTVGVYGTPTVFVDGTAIVGPKPARVYSNMLKN